MGDGVNERLVLFVAADFAHQENSVEYETGDQEGKDHQAEQEQPGLAPTDDHPADVQRNGATDQADAQKREERD